MHVVAIYVARRNPNNCTQSQIWLGSTAATQHQVQPYPRQQVLYDLSACPTYLISSSYICNLKRKAADLKAEPYQAIEFKPYLGEKEVPQPQPLSAFGLSITCQEFEVLSIVSQLSVVLL